MPALHNNALTITSYVQNDPLAQLPYDALPYLLSSLNKALLDNGSGVMGAMGGAVIGYLPTGGGGTVTQLTSKSTGVTLNAPSGQITMNNANLAATTSVQFTLTNSAIGANDAVIVSIASGATASSYQATVDAVAAGSCKINLRNYTAGGLAEAVVLNYAVIRGSLT